MKRIEAIARKALRSIGYDLMKKERADQLYFAGAIPYMTDTERRIVDACLPYTQTGLERLFTLIRATQYIVKNRIAGDFVECGVWKGGSIMAMAMTLDSLGETRDLFLFDTFTGMPPGTEFDVDLEGNNERWYREESDPYIHVGKGEAWNAASLDEVKKNLASFLSTRQRFHVVQGKVEETVPARAPERIALLRLDTDFYTSTKHGLSHLYPRLVEKGILIMDDYGHFLGARKAADEYFDGQDPAILLQRIDYTGVIGIKPGSNR